MSAPPLREDRNAGFTGLLVALLFLLLVIVSIVKMTNNHYAGERAKAEATH